MKQLINLLKLIWAWQERKGDWRSWLVHSGGAVLFAVLLTSFFALRAAVHGAGWTWSVWWAYASIAVVFLFFVREAEQAVHTEFAGEEQPWIDHVMDVLGPALVLRILAWVF